MFLPECNDVIKEFRLEAHIICNIFHTRDVFWNNYINTTFHIMLKNVYYMFVTVSLVWSSGLFVLWVKHMIAGSSEVSRIISFLGIHQIPEVEAICHTTATSLERKDAARQDQANSFIFIHLQMKVGVPVEKIVSASVSGPDVAGYLFGLM